MLAGFKSRWTMPLLVGGFERVHNLFRDRDDVLDRQPSAGRCAQQIVAVDELHDERDGAKYGRPRAPARCSGG